MPSRRYYIGLMSGTSLDGVDAALADLSSKSVQVLAGVHVPFEPRLRAELLALNTPGQDEIHRAALLGNELARCYAAAVDAALVRAAVSAREVIAIGCHGQTVRHRPALGYTVQIGNPALLAELSGICVVADFRHRDVAAGGQGAPLVPAFHAFAFASPDEDRVVINLGGIANLTWLPRSGAVTGFDCGPGNCLLDLWAARHLGMPMDANGDWAAGGTVDQGLLERFLAEPYLSASPPKSTGRDLFNADWLSAHGADEIDARAAQATLLEFTAQCVSDACRRHYPGVQRLIVCGGGLRNAALMQRLAQLCSPVPVVSSETLGAAPELVEAVAFAWLAKMALEGLPASVPAVTGAKGSRVLGAIYPR
ncbi:MAG: anhydro-N-acetylmuramic acid kinase [Burkholderiales bacterium]